MSRLVGLVRHGSHDELGRVLSGRTTNVALNPAGRDEAAALARALAGAGVAAVLSSPQRRTVETAAILARALGPTPQVDPALDEIDFGEWSGRDFADLSGDAWDLWNTARATAPTAGGETMAAATARAAALIDRLGAGGGEPVLCVSHCDIIRGVVCHYLGLTLDNILRFSVDPGRICWLHADRQGGAQLLSLNARN
ncbi:histidine phosphatase family protein [Paracoccus marinus]|uniref:histidine phosphatase family protein n=1 Tax=Paracoccus marinus TaxID=288426 RepID=UPI00103F9C97|nr:histidine phosphatase family protein [Paracoccus marinus]GLS80636.1 phosphoglycerate mutase [Paracoccus marinus]